jgi:hypothetical protein
MKSLQGKQYTANSYRRYVSPLPPFDVLDKVLCNAIYSMCVGVVIEWLVGLGV